MEKVVVILKEGRAGKKNNLKKMEKVVVIP